MERAKHPKMAMIDSQHRFNIEAFFHRDDTGINEIYILVVVFAKDLGGPDVVMVLGNL